MPWWWRRKRERDLDREMEGHLELEAEEQRDAGLTPEQARYAARRALGNITNTKEEVREMWGWTWWEILARDFRYAARSLVKSPGFALTAVLTLALAIGAATIVFTVVDSVILKPLSYRDSESLVALWEHLRLLGPDPLGPNPRHVDAWSKSTSAFRGITLVRHTTVGLASAGARPRIVAAIGCLPNVLDILEVTPALGRGFLPEDGVAGRDNVVILTHALWSSEFHSDPKIVGQTLRLDDTQREIVGVLPASFHFPNGSVLRPFRTGQAKSVGLEPSLIVPVAMEFSKMEWIGNFGNWVALGRLKSGVSMSQARAQLEAAQAKLWQEIRSAQMPAGATLTVSIQPLHEAIVGDSKTGLWLLLAAVGGLMLIACLNLANAQLGRSLTHRRDAAVRAALGAARWRLVWTVLAENLLLATAGGLGGLLLAHASLGLLRSSAPLDLPRLAEVELNFSVLLFTLALTVAASLVAGLLPAFRMLGGDPQVPLQLASARSLGSRGSQRLRAALIGLQVFGCTVLLLVTGLFSKSLLHLVNQDKGLDTAQVAVAEVRLPFKNYKAEPSRVAFVDAVLQNLRSAPGVAYAGFVSAMPFDGEAWIEFAQRPGRPSLSAPQVNARWATPGYFEATRQRLVAGRFFEERDRNLNSVILSEGEARALWGKDDPIGGEVNLLGRTFTVIGVVGDSRVTSLKAVPAKMAFVPHTYRPPLNTFFLVRGKAGPEALVSALRDAVWKQTPNIAIARIKTLDEQLSDSLARERFQTLILVAFGAAALLLAMLGIYGVLSYSVAARRQEIGVRMALGATRGDVYSLTMSQAGVPVALGLAAGLAASLATGQFLEKFLYGTRAVDPLVMATVALLFLLAAGGAAFVPARRAASVPPMDALRPE